MLSTKAYSELLATLYAAPLDERQWQVYRSHTNEESIDAAGDVAHPPKSSIRVYISA
jgi:hypothetical protein